MMLAATLSLGISAFAEESWLKTVTFSGYLDLYYQSDFGKPATGGSVGLRQFDVNHNSFSLAALGFTAQRKPSEDSPFGFTFSGIFGRNAEIIHSLEENPESVRNILQAYVTYAVPGSPVVVDFGKFLTWIGYEGVAAGDNDNYSRSFLFYGAQPMYHTGLRAMTSFGAINVAAFLVNGWNEVEDSTGAKSYGASVSSTLGKTTVAANYYGGVERAGFGASGNTAVHLGDLVVVHPLTETMKLGLNADYGSADGTEAGDPSGKFYGIAGYFKLQLSDTLSGALRYETVSDKDGIRFGTDGRFTSLTGTLDFSLAPQSSLRLELRHDKSNRDVFAKENGALTDTRTTLTVAHILKF
jgi:hypothetical protein